MKSEVTSGRLRPAKHMDGQFTGISPEIQNDLINFLDSMRMKFSEGSYFEWNIVHISKFKAGTVEKNSSTIGPPAGIEPTPLAMLVQCSCH